MTGKRKKMQQLYFFMMPEETEQFLQHLLQADVYLLADRSKVDTPAVLVPSSDIGQSFLCPRDELANVSMNRATDSVFFLDPSVSPVVEFQGCFLRESNLSRGRLYLRSGYEGRDGWVAIADSIDELYSNSCAYLRTELLSKSRDLGAFLSIGAKAYVDAGGVLAQF